MNKNMSADELWDSLDVDLFDIPKTVRTEQQLSRFKEDFHEVCLAYRELEKRSLVKSLLTRYKVVDEHYSGGGSTTIYLYPDKGLVTEFFDRNNEWDMNTTEEKPTTDRTLFSFFAKGTLPDVERILKEFE